MRSNPHISFVGRVGTRILVWSIFIFTSCNYNAGDSNQVDTEGNIGQVVKVVDGDTYDVISYGSLHRIRMYGIDAPERGMDYYKVSKEYLSTLILGKDVRVERISEDRYGRTIARTFLSDGREIGHEMIRVGLAWHFKKYSDDSDLAALEEEAQAKRLGLWAIDNPQAPWEKRRGDLE